MRKEKTKSKRLARNIILISVAAILLAFAAIVAICLLKSRSAVQPVSAYCQVYTDAVVYLEDDGSVEIDPIDTEPAHKTGIIFYVGAQITPDAYIPLMLQLSEAGYYCWIPKLNCNMASLEPGAAEQIIAAHPEIESWYLAGHSMGGLTASGFADDHREEVDGLIFLAAYTNRDLSGVDMPTLSIYGDTDGVLNQNTYEKRLGWNAKDFEEHCILGANHAQYGDYGKQPRDAEATISAEDQRAQTVSIITDWLQRHAVN